MKNSLIKGEIYELAGLNKGLEHVQISYKDLCKKHGGQSILSYMFDYVKSLANEDAIKGGIRIDFS